VYVRKCLEKEIVMNNNIIEERKDIQKSDNETNKTEEIVKYKEIENQNKNIGENILENRLKEMEKRNKELEEKTKKLEEKTKKLEDEKNKIEKISKTLLDNSTPLRKDDEYLKTNFSTPEENSQKKLINAIIERESVKNKNTQEEIRKLKEKLKEKELEINSIKQEARRIKFYDSETQKEVFNNICITHLQCWALLKCIYPYEDQKIISETAVCYSTKLNTYQRISLSFTILDVCSILKINDVEDEIKIFFTQKANILELEDKNKAKIECPVVVLDHIPIIIFYNIYIGCPCTDIIKHIKLNYKLKNLSDKPKMFYVVDSCCSSISTFEKENSQGLILIHI
jgi:hypothetical protein